LFGISGTNPCDSSNGGCQYGCLPSAEASDGYICACPNDLVPDSNGRDCLSKQNVIVSLFTWTHKSPASYDCQCCYNNSTSVLWTAREWDGCLL